MVDVNQDAGQEFLASENPADSTAGSQVQDLLQLGLDRAASAASAVLELLKERPLVVGIVAAGSIGGLLGVLLAGRRRSTLARVADTAEASVAPAAEAVRKVAKQQGLAYKELVSIAWKLAQNPLVRAFVVKTVVQRVSKRFA